MVATPFLSTKSRVVGTYKGAYWFTSSTSFANPAVTIARSLTDTFAGTAPVDVPGYGAVELFGAFAATVLFSWMCSNRLSPEIVVIPHSDGDSEA